MSFKSDVGPISEIAIFHLFKLKRLETRLIKKMFFSNQESEGRMSYILGAK